MKNEITLQTRRQFLRTTVLGSALSWTVPAFLADTFAALHSEAADSATQIVTGKDATHSGGTANGRRQRRHQYGGALHQ